jgi:hypothetical protein
VRRRKDEKENDMGGHGFGVFDKTVSSLLSSALLLNSLGAVSANNGF